MNIIINITKAEAKELIKDYGVKFGENGISATGKNNGRRKYYICETKDNLLKLKKLQNSKLVK